MRGSHRGRGTDDSKREARYMQATGLSLAIRPFPERKHGGGNNES